MFANVGGVDALLPGGYEHFEADRLGELTGGVDREQRGGHSFFEGIAAIAEEPVEGQRGRVEIADGLFDCPWPREFIDVPMHLRKR